MNEATPMMRQYLEIKSKYPEVFLFFRMGDFYELFFEDAQKASKILNITLTTRGTHKGKEIPMCGVPFHSVDNYLSKMVEANEKVAICEQVEDPKSAKGVVKRKVVRVLTPGTVIDDSLLKSLKNNYLASLSRTSGNFGFSFAELSTGEFFVTEFQTYEELEIELLRVDPSELIVAKSLEPYLKEKEWFKRKNSVCFFQPDWIYEYKNSYRLLTEQFKTHSLDGYGISNYIPGVAAAGGIIHYVKENCPEALRQISKIQKYDLAEFMALDEATKRNLELLETPYNSKGITLVDILDNTESPMGGRLLRSWINAPLRNLNDILNRQNAVNELKEKYEILLFLKENLKEVNDLERIIGRIHCGNANPRDLIALKRSLKNIRPIREKAVSLSTNYLQDIIPRLKDFPEVFELIDKSIENEPPSHLREGNVIREGFNQELDELKSISKNAKVKIAEIQKNEIEKTGIKNLKIKFNNIFGYYLEVSKGQINSVPDYFIRKQTLVNAERYITPELKEWESKILGAEQKSIALEQKIFEDVREKVAAFGNEIKEASVSLAILDVLSSLAWVSVKKDYICPEVNDLNRIEIKEGRHPVVEHLLDSGTFISNDTFLDGNTNQILIITGPNMAGKSTYIRQTALLVLMAQIGAHIPAKEASIGIVDRIFTRIGAYDDLSSGKSTFMVEMNEMANILNNATERSLIVLDEIGRGTSTYDGISIAWAVIEYLYYQSNVKAKTLFATHYHELTCLEKKLKGIKNYNIAVKEWNEQILFIRKIIEGAADKSYGIHVARLAGLPKDVINRAKEILVQLESEGLKEIPVASEENTEHLQLEFFSGVKEVVPMKWKNFVKKFSQIDLNDKTPIQSINLLNEWIQESKQLLLKDK